MKNEYVNYESFGAAGDGRTDDIGAIVRAHAYANEKGLPVRTKADAVYYIGAAQTAEIRTDTDWNTSRFIIDDSAVTVEERNAPVFRVPAVHEFVPVPLKTLSRDTASLNAADLGLEPGKTYYIRVYDESRRQYIRFGPNQDRGSAQTDSFLLDGAGNVLSGINWDYETVSSAAAREIETEPLTVRGGRFTTIANTAESRYTYYARNIDVTRSNVTVENVYHDVTGEGDHGAPYGGFFSFSGCANAAMKNCHVTGHKIYDTIGSAGVRVSMGSYDINSGAVIGFTLTGVRQDDICNRTLWGVFGSNFCKQITFDGCVLSRTDAHCGVRDYVIRNSVLGWMGTNTIGFGEMLLENVTSYCDHLIGFRGDYGSTWAGNLTLRNVTWIPGAGRCVSPVVFEAYNPGHHDFGYPTSLPGTFTVDGLTVVDTNTPDGYGALPLFNDFRGGDRTPEEFPLLRPRTVTVRNLKTVSGRPFVLCTDAGLMPQTVLETE